MSEGPDRILCIGIALLMSAGCASFKPRELGIQNGKLRPCPPAPKCVSSYYTKGIHHIAPLTYTGNKEEAYSRLIKILQSFDRSAIITHEPDYIHAQFTVTPLNWIDDAEFLFHKTDKTIHYASSPAAKIGFWDWGENRRRAEKIRKLFAGLNKLE